RKPARTVMLAWGSGGSSNAEIVMEAASRTVPAAVTQLAVGRWDRNRARLGWEVWLSSSSANQSSHPAHVSARRSFQPMAWRRSRKTFAEGGLPALVSSFITSASRREKLA